MKIEINDWRGSLTWELSEELTDLLINVPLNIRKKILTSMQDNVGVVCSAILHSFGNDGMRETVNQIMVELNEVINRQVEIRKLHDK